MDEVFWDEQVAASVRSVWKICWCMVVGSRGVVEGLSGKFVFIGRLNAWASWFTSARRPGLSGDLAFNTLYTSELGSCWNVLKCLIFNSFIQ